MGLFIAIINIKYNIYNILYVYLDSQLYNIYITLNMHFFPPHELLQIFMLRCIFRSFAQLSRDAPTDSAACFAVQATER